MQAVVYLAVGLIGFGATGLFHRHQETHHTNVVFEPGTVITGTAKPEETPPDPSCAGRVADLDPRRIVLKTIGVEGCVQKVGRDAQGRIATPSNIHVAGWFVESPRPGAKGLSIVVGHETGSYSDGVFDKLPKLKPGSTFAFDLGDGTVQGFTVTSVRAHPAAATMKAMYADAKTQRADLALITCSGPWDRSTGQRANRLIVLAVKNKADAHA